MILYKLKIRLLKPFVPIRQAQGERFQESNKFKKLALIFLCLLPTLCFYTNIKPSSLDGTTNPIYQDYHHVFHSTDSAVGFVRLNNGFTVLSNATAYLDTFITISGAMDLRETGTLQLLSDLILDSGFTLSSGGIIKGNNRSIILNNNLIIPENKILKFIGDTIIDGNGNTLFLDNYAQIFIDSDITLTLKNLTLKTNHSIPIFPPLRLYSHQSKLCLDNVILNPTEDLYFREGQFFIHDDVIFSGSSSFIYESTQHSYITPHSTFKFDPNTTFSYNPTTTFDKNLIVLSDQTSTLYFDGSNLNATFTGMQLTKGSVVFDNNVNLIIPRTYSPTDFSTNPINAAAWTGSSQIAISVAWNPKNNYLAACGRRQSRQYNTVLYNFTGTALTTLATDTTWPITTGSFGPYQCAWSPDGKYLIVTGNQRTRIYDTSAGNLSTITQTKTFSGTTVFAAAFSPDGKYVVLQTSSNIQMFTFSNGSLSDSAIDIISWPALGFEPSNLYWRPTDGRYFIVNGSSLGVFEFDQDTIKTVTTLSISGDSVYGIAWSPDGKYILVGTSSAQIYIYEFTGGDLNQIYKINAVAPGITAQCPGIDFPVTWNKGKDKIVVAFLTIVSPTGGDNNLKMYKFEHGKLTFLNSRKYGDSYEHYMEFNKDGSAVALAGQLPTNGRVIQAYTINNSLSPTSLSNSITFGDSFLGPDYNLNVDCLGNSKIKIDAIINDDSI